MVLLAILIPPLAVLLCGKPIQALLNCVLTLFLWVPGAVHAILVVQNRKADKRFKKLEQAITTSTEPKMRPEGFRPKGFRP